MKKYFSFIIMLCLSFVVLSCGAARNEAVQAETSSVVFKDMSDLYGSVNRQMTNSNWEATGFNPEGLREVSMNNVSETAATSEPLTASRKLVKTTHLSIRVDNLNYAAEAISTMIEYYGAYSSSTQIEENRQTYNIRVPSTSYEAMLGQVNELGKVNSRSDFVEDVTLHYYDLEGRLDTQKELLKTFQSYLSKAVNMEEILSVEKKIAELQNEIDMYGSQFTALVNQIDYATIVLTVYGTSSAYTYETPSIWDRVKDLFGDYGDFLSGAVIVIIQIFVYGIPILMATAILFWLLLGKIGLLRKLWRLVAKKKE